MPWHWNTSLGVFQNTGGWWLFLIAWSVFWKGIALWNAAKRSQKAWFIAFMLIQSGGIVELFYLLFVSNAFSGSNTQEKSSKKKAV
jgi:lipoprotein signal peptidase